MIELLIVVVIIGVVYMLAVQNLQSFKEPATTLSLKNIKEYLYAFPHTKSVQLLCLDDCSSCNIIVDDYQDPTIDSIDDFIDDSIQTYQYDFHLGFQEQAKQIFFTEDNIEKSVCFSLSVDKQGVSEQVIVKFKDKIYDYTPYLTPTPVYNSLKELAATKGI